MKTITAKFSDYEKDLLHEFIVANGLYEPRCREREGHEFIITNNNFSTLRNMTLDVTLVLFEDCDDTLPPEPATVIRRSVKSFSYKLIDGGDEVQTNLDASFEDRVIKSLEIYNYGNALQTIN